MQKITTATELKIAIQELEIKQANDWNELKGQFIESVESLNAGKLIKNTLSELILAPNLKTIAISTLASLVTGFVTRKINVRKKLKQVKKLIP
ncbi:hypothetical protein [Fulvivirga sp.]|uniref:hypothetical protein n=1 Tax=Fulvivirga sp. TaxID=1931237 RepID=UPI0032EF9316